MYSQTGSTGSKKDTVCIEDLFIECSYRLEQALTRVTARDCTIVEMKKNANDDLMTIRKFSKLSDGCKTDYDALKIKYTKLETESIFYKKGFWGGVFSAIILGTIAIVK